MKRCKIYINGAWTESVSGNAAPTFNPATGEELAQVVVSTPEDVDRAVAAAHTSFYETREWRDMDSQTRGDFLLRIADLIAEAREELAYLDAVDMGKPLREAEGDVDDAFLCFRYYACLIKMPQVGSYGVNAGFGEMHSYTIHEPAGVVGLITPWNYPFLMGQGVWIDSEKLDVDDSVGEVLKHGTLSVGFIGLAETLVALTGKHHGESPESQKLGLESIGHMRQRTDEESAKTGLNFTLLATPAEGLSGRFVRIDRKLYGERPGITDREYYTNSFHVPVYYPISAFEKIAREAPYHELTNGGHISYIELDGDPTQNLEAFEAVVRAMKEAGIGYGAINHPIDRDPVCGYTGIIGEVCPRCGRREGEGVPLSKLQKLGLYKNYNSTTIGYHGDPAEEADRQPNTLKIVKK